MLATLYKLFIILQQSIGNMLLETNLVDETEFAHTHNTHTHSLSLSLV